MMRQLIYILLFNAKHYLYEKGHIRTRPELMYREPDIARSGDWGNSLSRGPDGSAFGRLRPRNGASLFKYGKRLITE